MIKTFILAGIIDDYALLSAINRGSIITKIDQMVAQFDTSNYYLFQYGWIINRESIISNTRKLNKFNFLCFDNSASVASSYYHDYEMLRIFMGNNYQSNNVPYFINKHMKFSFKKEPNILKDVSEIYSYREAVYVINMHGIAYSVAISSHNIKNGYFTALKFHCPYDVIDELGWNTTSIAAFISDPAIAFNNLSLQNHNKIGNVLFPKLFYDNQERIVSNI